MCSVKDKLLGALGGFGLVLWYIISIILVFAPLYVLNLPWWGFLIAFIVINIAYIGGLAMLGAWIWSLIYVLNYPIPTLLLIIYIIAAAFYIFTSLIPAILELFKPKEQQNEF